jgi:hypothetical protein
VKPVIGVLILKVAATRPHLMVQARDVLQLDSSGDEFINHFV